MCWVDFLLAMALPRSSEFILAKRIYMQRRGQYLMPADSDGQELISKLKLDELVYATISRPRNLKHHKKFFKMIGEVFKAQTFYLTQERMLNDIKVRMGHCDVYKTPEGTEYIGPRSISFAEMDQIEFGEFYNKFLDYCLQVIIPGVNKPDFEEHLLSIIDGRNYVEMRR